jgi:uncharacterized membrane protein
MTETQKSSYTKPQVQPNGAYVDTYGDEGFGWKLFAGTMLLIAATFNIIDGLVAITNANYYASIAATHNVQLPLTNNIHAWGWTAFIFGLVLLMGGFGVFTGAMWARVIGVAIVSLNMIFRMAFLAAFPFWGIVMLFIDGLVIYGLVVHGGREPEPS